MYVFPPAVRWIVIIGIVVVVLLLLLYKRLLKWLKKRKATPMEQGVIGNTSTAPQGISEAAKMARLDDLRKKFEDGIEKFHAAGKSLYNFPWYMIVGEPGSGKTEAIRHCNVGFPPGLQDQFQGAGGTLNMNWWFTDHAVILDTAGRLMFEEVETGGSGEWTEFLKLIKKNRPRCPINGVFLVIPADSLIKDSADEIEQKASKIARQFNVIQRTLDVRFPVFVVITKSDLINGFRDFFEGLDDPQLQHQILGWSNHAPLDEPYNPEFVDQHLQAIQECLSRRRLGLIQETVSDDSQATSKWNLDTLYAFPDSITRIAPRMTRYLELIFSVGSKWSGKPLFFRGIYFTSSMREGSALDEDLAESLGVPVESLPEGRVWERDRAYFLRDLFMKKVFREKGLVTYATNATKQHMQRKAAVLITAAASVLFLLLFTFYAAVRFNKSIGDLKFYLAAPVLSSDRLDEELQVLKAEPDGSFRYIGRAAVRGMPDDVKRFNFSTRLADSVDRWEKKGVPWIFAPASKFASRIRPEQLSKAQAVIYEAGVIQPFVAAASNIMVMQEKGKWTRQDEPARALRQLIRLRAKRPLNAQAENAAQAFFDPLFGYVLASAKEDEDPEAFKSRIKLYADDKPRLYEPFPAICDGDWSLISMATEPNWADAAIRKGVDLFNEYWMDDTRLSEQSKDYALVDTMKKLKIAFDKFDAAEQRLLSLADRFDLKSAKPYIDAQWKEASGSWTESFAVMTEADKSIRKHISALKDPESLEDAWDQAAKTALQDVNDNYRFLLAELKGVQEQGFIAAIRDKLQQGRTNVMNRLRESDFEQRLKTLNETFYLQVKGAGRLFEMRFEMYSKANEQIVVSKTVSGLQHVSQAVKDLEKAVTQARNRIDELLNLDRTAFRLQDAADLSKAATDSAQQRQVYDIVKIGLETAPKTIEELQNLIETQAKWDWACIPPEIVEKKYDPVMAAAVLGGWKAIGDTVTAKSYVLPPELKQTHHDANDSYNKYIELYLDDYWLGKVTDHLVRRTIPNQNSWKAQHTQLEKLVVLDVLGIMNELAKCVEQGGIKGFEDYVPAGYQKVKQFRAGIARVPDRLFQTKCERLLEKWVALGSDAFEARNALMRSKPIPLVKDYFSFLSASPAEFIDWYWTLLARESLATLVGEVQAEQVRSIDKLKTQYGGKFPLAKDSSIDLTQDEFVDAYTLYSKSGLQADSDPTTVGGGGATGNATLDKLFERMRSFSTADKWALTTKQLFDTLPRPGAVYHCRVTLLSEKEQYDLLPQGETLLLGDFTEFRLVQANQKGRRLRTRARDEKGTPVATIKYPGPPAAFEFYRYPSDPDNQPRTKIEFTQPWSSLRMLATNAEPDKGAGYIKINVKDKEGLGGVLYLKLEFCKEYEGDCKIELPKISDWPAMQR